MNNNIQMVAIDLIEPNPYQPRLTFEDEALMELAQSIRQNGLVQPITVREVNGIYQIIAGERRYRALRLNGALEVPVHIMDANEAQMAELGLIENIQRENLSAIEEAKSYLEIMRLTNMTQTQLALKIGKSQSAIANKIRLLQLDETIQEAISNHEISERHARALLSLDPDKQKETLAKVQKKKLNVAQTEKLVKQTLNPKEEKPKTFSKGISKNVRIAINTIHQALKMVARTGIQAQVEEEEQEDEVLLLIRIPK